MSSSIGLWNFGTLARSWISILTFATLVVGTPPCYIYLPGDAQMYWTSTSERCSSKPPGVVVAPGATVPSTPATQLIATQTTSGSEVKATFTPSKAPSVITVVQTGSKTTVTSTVSSGQYFWMPIIIVPVGAPPPPPPPPIVTIPFEPEITPTPPEECKPYPVQACTDVVSTHYFGRSQKIESTTEGEVTCATTTACNPSIETITSTVSKATSAVIAITQSYIDPAYPEDKEWANAWGDSPDMQVRLQRLAGVSNDNGPIKDPSCGDGNDSRLADRAEVERNIDEFCDARRAVNIKSPDKATLSQDFPQKSERDTMVRLSAEWNSKPFGCSDSGVGYWIDPGRCRALLKNITGKCKRKEPDKEEGGQIEDGCARFKIGVDTTRETRCYESFDRLDYYRTFSLENANDAINSFCRGPERTLDPKVPLTGDRDFCQFCGPVEPRVTSQFGETMLQIVVQYDLERKGCEEPKAFKFADDADECIRILQEPVNGCDTGTTSAKWGGDITQTNGVNGCVKWTIWAYKKDAQFDIGTRSVPFRRLRIRGR